MDNNQNDLVSFSKEEICFISLTINEVLMYMDKLKEEFQEVNRLTTPMCRVNLAVTQRIIEKTLSGAEKD